MGSERGLPGAYFVELPAACLLRIEQRVLAIALLQEVASDGRVYTRGNRAKGEYVLCAYASSAERALAVARAIEERRGPTETECPGGGARATVECARTWKAAPLETVRVLACPECGGNALEETCGNEPQWMGTGEWEDEEQRSPAMERVEALERGFWRACVSCGWNEGEPAKF